MVHNLIETLDAAGIKALIDNSVAESKTLEYKADLPQAWTPEATKEFLADISAFANAEGGLILYGIEESKGANGKGSGEPESANGISAPISEKDILTIQEKIRDGIAPRLQGVSVKPITGFPKGPVIAIGIPRSYAAPHMVTYRSSSRFFSRAGSQKYPLSVDEIRFAFLLSDTIPERSRKFRDERIAKIISEDVPFNLLTTHQIIIHLVPAGAWTSRSLDLRMLVEEDRLLPQPPGANSWHTRMNLDGVVVSEKPWEDGATRSYYQVFRSGCLEAFYADAISSKEKKTVEGATLTRIVVDRIVDYLGILKLIGIAEPVAIFITLQGYAGCRLTSTFPMDFFGGGRKFDRDSLMIPELVIESPDAPRKALTPLVDLLWQAASYKGCPEPIKQAVLGE